MAFIKNPPSTIFYCYGVWQRLYDDMKAAIPTIQFVEGLPTKEMMETWAWKEPYHKVIAIDDCLQVASKSDIMVDLFTKFSHHLNFSVFSLCKTYFPVGNSFEQLL